MSSKETEALRDINRAILILFRDNQLPLETTLTALSKAFEANRGVFLDPDQTLSSNPYEPPLDETQEI